MNETHIKQTKNTRNYDTICLRNRDENNGVHQQSILERLLSIK